jgi:hypothetical protein
MEYIFLLLGLFLLIKGADVFVAGAASVAAKFKVPPLIIGLTVVSFGTSAPEAAISISASLSGSNSISLGNVIGSNFFNLLTVIGITALVTPLKADDEVIRRDMPAVFLATGGLAIIILDGVIMRYEAIFLLAALGIYLFAVIKRKKRMLGKMCLSNRAEWFGSGGAGKTSIALKRMRWKGHLLMLWQALYGGIVSAQLEMFIIMWYDQHSKPELGHRRRAITMAAYQYITLREKPEWEISAAQWFHSK